MKKREFLEFIGSLQLTDQLKPDPINYTGAWGRYLMACRSLPYGVTEAGLVFNRDYCVIGRMINEQIVLEYGLGSHPPGKTTYFYNDVTQPAENTKTLKKILNLMQHYTTLHKLAR